jgi:hypothetical protein
MPWSEQIPIQKHMTTDQLESRIKTLEKDTKILKRLYFVKGKVLFQPLFFYINHLLILHRTMDFTLLGASAMPHPPPLWRPPQRDRPV